MPKYGIAKHTVKKFDPGKYGISEIVVRVYKSDGMVATAFPRRGSSVWVWDNTLNIWVNKV